MSIFHQAQTQCDVRLNVTPRTNRSVRTVSASCLTVPFLRRDLQQRETSRFDLSCRIGCIHHGWQMRDSLIRNSEFHAFGIDDSENICHSLSPFDLAITYCLRRVDSKFQGVCNGGFTFVFFLVAQLELIISLGRGCRRLFWGKLGMHQSMIGYKPLDPVQSLESPDQDSVAHGTSCKDEDSLHPVT